MERLKRILCEIDDCNVTKFREIYEDDAYLLSLKNRPDLQASVKGQTYFYEDIAFELEEKHRLKLEMAVVTISIPLQRLNIEQEVICYSKEQRRAAEGFFAQCFEKLVEKQNESYISRTKEPKYTGMMYFCGHGQVNIQTNYAVLDNSSLKLKMQVLMPVYKDREKKLTINGKKAARIMARDLPYMVVDFINGYDISVLWKWLETADIQSQIRAYLSESEYCAFVANQSILPRYKGTDLPQPGAVPFLSPKENEIEVPLQNGGRITGMGIKKGVTMITGGGYSGKSTLLDAIAEGVYNHIPGDGREFVITDETAVKIPAEDGRSVKKVDLSPFIKWLPGGDARNFSTEHASGSTSQAANVIEAVSFGSTLLLIDEDKSAANFLIRDERMRRLIIKEPITPYTERVRQLCRDIDVSTIIVVGGSGEFLSVADSVLMMDDYKIGNVTAQARAICQSDYSENIDPVEWKCSRMLKNEGFSPYPKGSAQEKCELSETGFVLIGDEMIDLRKIGGIVSEAQLNALTFMIRSLELCCVSGVFDLKDAIDALYRKIESDGLDCVYSSIFTNKRWLEMPRKYELYAAICRMRNIIVL